MVWRLDGRPLFRRSFGGSQVTEDRKPLVLVNGLAEQSESWAANRAYWSRHFDVEVPELLVYDSDVLQDHIATGGDVTVDYLVGRLSSFLDDTAQDPPYNFVGSSLGAQVIITYAARNPEKVARLVLICASGLGSGENLPIMEGVRRSRYDTLVESVFYSKRFATAELVDAVATKLQNRRWRKGVLHTLRGTVGHSVAGLLEEVSRPCLAIWGAEDRVISDVPGSIRAVSRMPRSRQVVLPRCGHAPQIEKSREVNLLVSRFLNDKLKDIPESFTPARSFTAR